jgi:hypothetical protein
MSKKILEELCIIQRTFRGQADVFVWLIPKHLGGVIDSVTLTP